MSLSAVTMAFKLSTIGNGVAVAVGLGISVGGMGVKVSVGGRAVAVALSASINSLVAEAGSAVGFEASAQALRTMRIQVKIRARFMVFPSDPNKFSQLYRKVFIQNLDTIHNRPIFFVIIFSHERIHSPT